jgi:hypothetical protein
MTLVSQPGWWLVAAYAAWQAGLPGPSQLWLAGGVALGSGVVATVLFFQATGMVRDQPAALGAVEAMQGAEILFASALGVAWLGEPWPRGRGARGAAIGVRRNRRARPAGGSA